MSFKGRIGKSHRFMFNFKGNDYELTDPKSFLMDLFTYPEYPTAHVDMVIISLIGSMGSGKSCAIDYIINLLYSIYGSQLHAFKTNDLVYALKHGVDLGFVQLVIIDDALQTGFDSRQSMTSENIDMSQNFSIGRHIAKEKMGKGILFVVFAIQSPSRLDKFIRENCDLTIYKTFYPQLEKEKALPPEEIQFIKDFTEASMLRHDFTSRGSALGITRTNKPIRFYFPLQKPAIDVPFIAPESPDLTELRHGLMRLDLDDMSANALKGFIDEFCEGHDLTLTNKMIQKTINQVAWAKYQGLSEGDQELVSAKDREKQQQLELIHKMRQQNISYRKIADTLGMSFTAVYDQYRCWIKKKE
jgi:hypothetical protein